MTPSTPLEALPAMPEPTHPHDSPEAFFLTMSGRGMFTAQQMKAYGLSCFQAGERAGAADQRARMMQPIPMPLGGGSASASISCCGCSSWTDGFGNKGEYKCQAHRAPPATRAEMPAGVPPEDLQTLILSLKASKGWMTAYAEAFVDDILERAALASRAAQPQAAPLSVPNSDSSHTVDAPATTLPLVGAVGAAPRTFKHGECHNGCRFKTDCPNMKDREGDTSMTHEHYDCAVCGAHVSLDYDEMR